ncbi:unnamed protein product [Calicophoron daubneyi]|uniref:Fibronectin type-III domain-containing protein n=1 Tax=Calicophoron daubneyi TaxID=300641 RepID=A0AAV2T375_CALDB
MHYVARVYAKDTKANIQSLPSIGFGFQTQPEEPPKPSIRSVENVRPGVQKLIWNETSQICECQHIITRSEGNYSGRDLEVYVPCNTTEYIFTGLRLNTVHVYRLRTLAQPGDVLGPLSDAVSLATSPSTPPPPTNVTVSDIKSKQFTVKWQPAETVEGFFVDRFIVTVHPVDHAFKELSKEVSGYESHSVIFTDGVTSCMHYVARVYAKDTKANIQSLPSIGFGFQTQPEGKLRNSSFTEFSPFFTHFSVKFGMSAFVSWK